ncbi:MAG: hypothetical protein UX62_C0017G0017 [Microgenomates group bacterium GW2011_GWA2_46_7]|nr:MAG: hypothetical protein UX62_C0017G0017 [Microgenomates group bacterium GW2011_GWA2_46_7]
MAGGGGDNRKAGERFNERLGFDYCCVVGITVNNNDFEVTESLSSEIPQELGQIFGLIERGNDDGKERFIFWHGAYYMLVPKGSYQMPRQKDVRQCN